MVHNEKIYKRLIRQHFDLVSAASGLIPGFPLPALPPQVFPPVNFY